MIVGAGIVRAGKGTWMRRMALLWLWLRMKRPIE
jgi:hypothetical protein